jgi:hypothetical protein
MRSEEGRWSGAGVTPLELSIRISTEGVRPGSAVQTYLLINCFIMFNAHRTTRASPGAVFVVVRSDNRPLHFNDERIHPEKKFVE